MCRELGAHKDTHLDSAAVHQHNVSCKHSWLILAVKGRESGGSTSFNRENTSLYIIKKLHKFSFSLLVLILFRDLRCLFSVKVKENHQERHTEKGYFWSNLHKLLQLLPSNWITFFQVDLLSYVVKFNKPNFAWIYSHFSMWHKMLNYVILSRLTQHSRGTVWTFGIYCTLTAETR